MTDDSGQLPTPLSPTAPSAVTPSGPSSTPGGSGGDGAGAGSAPTPATAPHAPFPTAAELMGGNPAATASGSSNAAASSSTAGAGISLPTNKFFMPATPEELYNMITTTPGRDAPALIETLDALAGGSIMPPMNHISIRGMTSPLLLLQGIDFASLSAADIHAGTIGFLYVLTARLNARPDQRPPGLLEAAAWFCQAADHTQLVRVPTRVNEFAWSFLRYAQQMSLVDMSVEPLHTLLRRTSVSPYFNSVHAAFLEACLYSGRLGDGAMSLGVIYLKAIEGTSYIDVLTYNHHAGTILAAGGDFGRAADMFTFAVAVPTSTLSAIQIACAKRAILCELLNTGTHIQFPKDTSTVINRFMENNMPDYLTLAKAFANQDWKAAREAATNGAAIFGEDRNMGLVQQVIDSITKRRILNLRKTYSRLTLADLAAKIDLSGALGQKQVVDAVTDMVVNQEIRASVTNEAPRVVTFLEDDDYASPARMAELKRSQQLASWLQRELEHGNREMTLNKKWMAKQVRMVDHKGGDDKGRTETLRKGAFDPNDDIGPAPVRGVGSNLADMGF